jgi:hypothetical protein
MTPGSGSQAARVKRWLLWGVAAIALVGGIWVVIQLTARDQRRHGDPGTMQEILLTGDSRQTSLEGLSAQLDTTRRENDRLRQDVARLEGQIAKTIEGVRGAFERELQSDRSRNEGERDRERQRLDREFGRLQGQLGSDHKDADQTTDLAGFPPPPGRDPADSTPPPRRKTAAGTPEVGPTPLDNAIQGPTGPVGDQGPIAPPQARDRDRATASPPERRSDGNATPPPRRADTGPPPTRRGEAADVQTASLPGADLPGFPQLEQPALPEDALFADRQPPATPVPAQGAGQRRQDGTAPGQPPRPVIRIVGSDVPGNRPVPPRENETYRLPATSILTGTLITGLDAPTGAGSQRDPFPVLVRLQKTAILPNRYQADVRECFLLLAGYGDLSSERAYLRGETVSCVLVDGTVIETRLQGYAAGEDGKAGVRGRLVTKQGAFIARALLVGFLQGAADVLNKGDSITFGVSQSQTDQQNPWGSAALKGTGNALDRIAEFYIDQAYNLFPVIEVDAGREVDIVLTNHVDMPLPAS